MADNFEVEQPVQLRQNRMAQAFPGFHTNTFTFVISIIQVIYYIISVVLGKTIVNPSDCALFTLGANVNYT